MYMDIGHREKSEYFFKLTTLFGHGIVNDELDLTSQKQNSIEQIRHTVNNSFHIHDHKIQDDWKPYHVLLLLTHKCSFRCNHCYIFSDPQSHVSLSDNAIYNIFESPIGETIQSVTVSGGEPFLSENLYSIIKKYPVRSLFTNMSWCFESGKRNECINNLSSSLEKNIIYQKGNFTLYISLDKYHNNKTSSFQHIGKTIELLTAMLPVLNIVISHAHINQDNSLEFFFNYFKNMGYVIRRINETLDNELTHCDFVLSKQTHDIKISIDIFPLSNISRTLLTQEQLVPHENDFSYSSFNKKIADKPYYVISPDGRVALYDVFMVPPIPYSLGNFNVHTWDDIINTVSHDPISVCMKKKEYSEILHYYHQNHTQTYKRLIQYVSSVQQLLYFLFLHTRNRLSLNLYLYKKYFVKYHIQSMSISKPFFLTGSILVVKKVTIPKKRPVIIMDIHGVIFNSTWIDELKEVYTIIMETDRNINDWIAFNLQTNGRGQRIQKLHELSGKSCNFIHETFMSVKSKYHDEIKPVLKDNILTVLEDLMSLGIPIILISGSREDVVLKQLDLLNLTHYFDKKCIYCLNSDFENKNMQKDEILKMLCITYKNNTIVLFEDWIENLNLQNYRNLIAFYMPQYQNNFSSENFEQLITARADYVLKNWNDWIIIKHLAGIS